MKISLILALSFLILSSCLKKQNLDESDLGPVADAMEVESKMYEAIGGFDPTKAKKNEINSISAVQIIEDSTATKRYQQDLVITDLIDTADAFRINMLFNRQDFGDSSGTLSNKPVSLNYTKTQTAQLASILSGVTANDEQPDPFILMWEYQDWSRVCHNKEVGCYNFNIGTSKLYIPAEKANPAICSDVNKCVLDTKTIQFDIRLFKALDEQGKPKRRHFKFVVSPQMPYFSKVLSYCIRGLATLSTRQGVMEDCFSVTDFSYGQE